MGNFCLTIMANALRTYAIYRCMRHFFLKRSEKKLLELSIYLCFICLTSGGYLIFNNMFVNITTNILGLFTITMLYTGDKWKKILMVGLIYIVNIIIESGVLFAFSYNTNTKMMVSVYECITSMGILLLVVILEKTTKGQKDNLQLKSFLQIFLLAVPCASICMVVVLVYNQPEENIVMVVQAGGLLIINLIMFYLFDALQKFYVQKQEKEILEQQLALYDNELEIIKRSYDNIRALRHDMKHHLIELKFLSKEGSHEMISYIEKMEQSICNPEQYVDSGNRDLDSTLNYLLQKAERLLNKTEIHIVLPENLPIHPFTMNVIMGNLLDNAIEASEKSEEKYLGLNIKVKRGLLFIKVENSFTNEIEVKNNRIITTKKDKQKHGIGLKSVRHIVEEEGGIMNISWEENIFCVTVMLYLYLPKE